MIESLKFQHNNNDVTVPLGFLGQEILQIIAFCHLGCSDGNVIGIRRSFVKRFLSAYAWSAKHYALQLLQPFCGFSCFWLLMHGNRYWCTLIFLSYRLCKYVCLWTSPRWFKHFWKWAIIKIYHLTDEGPFLFLSVMFFVSFLVLFSVSFLIFHIY